jgi:molybdate transport system regulatory protein
MKTEMKVAYKIWLEADGKAFGEGPYRLLKGVEKTGSLHQAAIEMGMSYRKAWNTLNGCEKRLGFALLERRVGGVAGGGSGLTIAGEAFVTQYERFREEMATAVEKTFLKFFG